MAQALNLLADFDAANTNIGSGITSLLQGLELIVDYTDRDLTTLYKGNEINLYNELFYRLNRLPETFSIKFAHKEIDLTAKQRERKTVALAVSYNKNGQEYPCSNFPVCFIFSSGKGEIIPNATTDENGTAELIINRITSFSNPQFIEAKPDKAFWLTGRDNPVVKTMFNNLRFMPVS